MASADKWVTSPIREWSDSTRSEFLGFSDCLRNHIPEIPVAGPIIMCTMAAMKAIVFSFLAAVMSMAAPALTAQLLAVENASSLNVISFNIRNNNPADGEHAWPNRKENVASVMRFHQADVIGMQEALRGQIDDLQALLPEFAWVGVGRDDGASEGEFSPIFYRRDRFAAVDNGTFWLSETPEVVASRSWDAAITRIASWVILEDRLSFQRFFLLNTHFDHRGEQARAESAQLIVDRVEQLAGLLPVIISGDFNASPSPPAYRTMTASFADSYHKSNTAPHGPQGTFGGFVVGASPNVDRIDHVFVDDSIDVLRYGILSDQWNGSYPSDHLPVMVEVMLPP